MSLEFQERSSTSEHIEKVWRIENGRILPFLSVAKPHPLLLFGRERGNVTVQLRGPETKATLAHTPDDAEFLGIFLKLGTFVPSLPFCSVLDGDVNLPNADGRSFWIDGARWEIPSFENAEFFVAALVKQGILHRDETVEAALQGESSRLSNRALQRRFLRATGMTHAAIKQIQRAQETLRQLGHGTSILDAVHLAGYADQSHLTRSLTRYIGQTPAQIMRSPMSTSIF